MFTMKVAILVLALVAVVAYAAPETNNEDAEVEEFLKHLMIAHKQEGASVEDFIHKLAQQEEASEQEEGELQSSLAQNNDDDEDAILQEIIARTQDPSAKAQWRRFRFRRVVRRVGRFVKKVAPKVLPHIPYVGTAYRAYRAYKCYRG